MQQKSVEKCSEGERVKLLRVRTQKTWEGLALELGLTPSMLYQVARGSKHLSDRALYRLDAAERAAGLVPSGPDSRLTIPEPRAKPGSSDMESRAGRSLSSLRADLAAMRAKILAEFERLEKRLDELEG